MSRKNENFRKWLAYLNKRVIISFLIFSCCFTTNGQQNNNWYFGQRAGISFNYPNGQLSPTPLADGKINADEGSASISDANGNLLFYTNGIQVYNKQHQLMLNGDNLSGNISACQSVIIIPVPGNDSIYYLFTTDAVENNFTSGYRYSIVNMNHDNGNGEVVSKNILLWASCTERLTAARHGNGTDYWVITNDFNSDTFRAWLISCNGLQMIPVISHAGLTMSQDVLSNTGYMKVSPDGKFLCQTHFPLFDPDISTPNFAQLFDFNNISGQITNAKTIQVDIAMYNACEFSADSKLLYLVRTFEKKIDQLEVSLPTLAAIEASTITIPTNSQIFTLQLGPDEKIYSFRPGQTLGVINYPTIKGIACNFQETQLDVSPFYPRYGSPNFINDVAFDPNNSFDYTILDSCNGRVQFSGITSMPGTLHWEWDFGDGTTSILQNPLHIFTPSNQQYTVTLKILSSLSCGSIKSSRVLKPSGSIVNADFEYIIRCDSGYVRFSNKSIFNQNGNQQYVWDFGDGTISTAANPIHTYGSDGIYLVKLKLLTGAACIDDSMTQTVEVKSFSVTASPDQVITVGQSVTITILDPAARYHWSPDIWLTNTTIRNPTATPLTDITYKIEANNGEGCKGEDSVKIKVLQYNDLYVPGGFTPDNNGLNDRIMPYFNGQTTLEKFSIFNRWGQKVFETNERNKGWDGKLNNVLQSAGVYIWYVKAILNSGLLIEKKGSFVLIR